MVSLSARRFSGVEMQRTSGARPAVILAILTLVISYPADHGNAGAICTLALNNQEYACAAQLQSTIYNSRAVSSIVGGRVVPDLTATETDQTIAVSYAPTTQSEDPTANAVIDQAVSTATNDQAMVWNAWIDASFVHTDRSHPMFAYDGPLVTASVGLDRSIGESSVIGLLANYEHVNYDTVIAGAGGRLDSDSFGIGAYGGTALTANIVADAMFIYSWGDNEVVDSLAIVPTSYDSERIQAAGNLTGYWFQDAWRYSPAVGVTWSREDLDAYAGVPSRKLESAIALASMQIGRTHFFDDVRWIEPWIGISGEWEFHTSGLTSGVPGLKLDPFDVRILGGIDTQLSQSVRANIRADIAGLARKDYIVGSIGGQLAIRF